MQTIYLDISNKGVIPVIYAKQGDVGRKVEVVLTNSGLPYEPEAGSAFSAWFSGASGVGNYTDIGDKSAFSVSGNKVTVELITQMLQNPGEGFLCLVLSRASGDQIGLWNIRYICEGVPGAGSEPAKDYYTAFSEAVAGLAYPDSSLSVAGKAADAAATGKALEGKAPAGYGLGSGAIYVKDLNTIIDNGFYYWGTDAVNAPFKPANGGGSMIVLRRNENHIYQFSVDNTDSNIMAVRNKISGVWGEWEHENPPMIPGVEYRTTERWDGKAVYTKAIECGALGNNTADDITHDTENVVVAWVCGGYYQTEYGRYSLPYVASVDGNQVFASATENIIHRVNKGMGTVAGMTVEIKYIKSTD